MVAYVEYRVAKRVVKNDRWKAWIWPGVHWSLARGVCLGIVILALVLASLGIMTSAAAFVAALLGVGYVLLLTWRYTTGARNRQ